MKVWCFGCGFNGEEFWRDCTYCEDIVIEGYFDNFAQEGDLFRNLPKLIPNEENCKGKYIVVTTNDYYELIKNQLENIGLVENNNFVSINRFWEMRYIKLNLLGETMSHTDFLGSVDNRILNNAGNIEWVDYWIENADKCKKRILIIGDSVSRQFRKIINNNVSELYVCDLLAMSHSLFQNITYKVIKFYLEELPYKYEYILFNLGGHHGLNIRCLSDNKLKTEYFFKLEKILKLLSQFADNIVFLPATYEKKLVTNIERNKENFIRNNILYNFATEKGYKFYDINKDIEYDKVHYSDSIHLENFDVVKICDQIVQSGLQMRLSYNRNWINDVSSLKKILKLNKEIYIWGNDVFGKKLRNFIVSEKYNLRGYIVSENYNHEEKDVYLLDELTLKNIVVLVTDYDTKIIKKLERRGYIYFTIGYVNL